MHSSVLATVGKKQTHNTLVIDWDGTIGEPLAALFANSSATVLVSRTKPPTDSSIIHIPFSHVIPEIPDGFYACMVYVFHKDHQELLEPVMKKAAEDKTNFFIVVSSEYVPLLSEALSKTEVYGQVVVIGDVFGTGKEEIDRWLQKIRRTKIIQLSGMGLTSWYPVKHEDALSALYQLMTSSHQAGHAIYLIAPSHPVTQLTIAHRLQKEDPLLHIDFSPEVKEEGATLPKGKHVLEGYQVLDTLLQYYHTLSLKTNETDAVPFSLFASPVQHPSQKKKQHLSVMHFFVYTIIIFLLMPAILMLTTAGVGKWLLLSGIDDIKSGKLSQAQQKIHAASSNIAFSEFSSQLVSRELSTVGQQYLVNPFTQQLSVATQILTTLTEGLNSGIKLESVLEGTSSNPAGDIKDSANGLKETLIMLQQLQTQKLPDAYMDKLSLFLSYAPYVETLSENLPELVGADGNRKYLVLFQNNTELRPGGGFIGSYGVLTLHDGKVENFSIHDVYEADGQLKGHVEPPYAIRRYMPRPHLYLRDSNFDVDFVKDAQKASFMLQAETGDQVDGVVGIDLSFVQAVVGAFGNIYVPGYNQTVTKDNFFLLTESHAEKNFFPGSTQKKDFLSSLFLAMQEKMREKNGISHQQLLESIRDGIEEKHVLFAFNDPSVQAALSVNGFSSSLVDTRESSPATINDFLGINEANIGGNKVNYSLQRSIDQKVVVTDTKLVKETTTITLTNTSDGAWPGGIYKNYLRVILPKEATLDGIVLNGVDQKIVPAVIDPQFYEAPGFVAPKGLEVEQTEEEGKSLYGFLVTVPTKSSLVITLSYTLNTLLSLTQTFPTYSMHLFKQPGIDTLPYSLTVTYPGEFSVFKTNTQGTIRNNTVSFEDTLLKDTNVEATFFRK